MRFRRILSLVLVVVLAFSTMIIVAAANNINTNGDYDVVFVIDASDSMNASDPNKLSFEAVQLFVNKLPASTTRFGIVVYTDEIVKELALTSDKNAVESFAKSVKYAAASSDPKTDIPLGLKEATRLLESSASNKDKIIIMLTDGKVESRRNANQLKNDLTAAENAGNKIFTIGINGNGTAQTNKEYLSDIAKKTNGECYIVRNSEELANIFNKIYVADTNSQFAEVSSNGDFDVDSYVVEAMIEVYHNKNITWELTSPSGKKYTTSADDITVKDFDYSTAISVFCPEEGKWNISVKKDASDKTNIKPTCILSYNLSFEITLDYDKVAPGSTIGITATAFNSQNKLTEKPELFQRYTCKAIIKDSSGSPVDEVELTPNSNGFSGQYTLSDKFVEGQYTVSGILDGSRLSGKASKNVANLEVGAAYPFVDGTNSGSNQSPSSQSGGIPWYLFVIIGVVVLAVVAIIIYKIKEDKFGKERLGGTVEYEWRILDTGESSQPYSVWNFNTRVTKKCSLKELLNNRAEFSFAENIFLGGMKASNGLIVNALCNKASADVLVLKDGVPVSVDSTVTLDRGSQITISNENGQIVEIKITIN